MKKQKTPILLSKVSLMLGLSWYVIATLTPIIIIALYMYYGELKLNIFFKIILVIISYDYFISSKNMYLKIKELFP